MAYLPKWELLGDVLKRVLAAPKTEQQAKVEICNAIADREIDVRVFHGERSYEGGNVSVPKLLKPADLDWGRSRPFEPWLIGPMPGQHYFWDPERLRIDLVQVSTADVERLFGTSPNSRADDTAAKRGGKHLRIKEYLAEYYPEGVDGPAYVPRRGLQKKLIEWDQSLKPLDNGTLKKAIDEYNASLKSK